MLRRAIFTALVALACSLLWPPQGQLWVKIFGAIALWTFITGCVSLFDQFHLTRKEVKNTEALPPSRFITRSWAALIWIVYGVGAPDYPALIGCLVLLTACLAILYLVWRLPPKRNRVTKFFIVLTAIGVIACGVTLTLDLSWIKGNAAVQSFVALSTITLLGWSQCAQILRTYQRGTAAGLVVSEPAIFAIDWTLWTIYEGGAGNAGLFWASLVITLLYVLTLIQFKFPRFIRAR